MLKQLSRTLSKNTKPAKQTTLYSVSTTKDTPTYVLLFVFDVSILGQHSSNNVVLKGSF